MNTLLIVLALLAAVLALFTIVPRLREYLPQLRLRPHRGVPLWHDPRRAGLACILYLVWLLAIGYGPRLQAQVTPTTIYVLTNIPVGMLGGATANTTSNLFGPGNINTPPTNNIISLRQGVGMAAAATVITGASGTAGFSVNWAVTIDGTNWSTVPSLQLSNNMTASSTNVLTTNYAGATLNNYIAITPASVEWAGGNGSNVTGVKVIIGLGNVAPGGYGN